MIRIISLTAVPLVLLSFVLLYKIDKFSYRELLREDHLVEWLTFTLLVVSGLLSLLIAIRSQRNAKYHPWFFFAFFTFCILSSLEEISWGQRILNIESPDFFQAHSDQREINVHNVFQKWLHLKTKHIAAFVLFLYGACLPWFLHHWRVNSLLEKLSFVIPPVVLSPGFFIATLMMVDWPTGDEEEIGEFLFSLCFVLFMTKEYSDRLGNTEP